MSTPYEQLRRIEALTGSALGPIDALDCLDYLTEIIDAASVAREQVIEHLREHGRSWAEIGAVIGVSKQAAQKRYGAKPSAAADDPDQLTLS